MALNEWLTIDGLLAKLSHALADRSPLSLVRIGDGENLILAQDSIWSLGRVLNERWAIKANNGAKGVSLPNLLLRDEMVDAIKKADIIGMLPPGDKTINAPDYLKRPMTDQLFAHYGIAARYSCDARINRDLAGHEAFWHLLRGRRILLVTREVDQINTILSGKPYWQQIAMTIPFSHYDQMTDALQQIAANRHRFDVALFSCGVNAVVLAQRTAEMTGAVCLDFGKAANILIHGKPN
ncbi:GT-D fold domain-containing glycosyltransferase [Paenibacillus silvisoli]|uniref:GT-D fold domain-containing glycosyltransferase n=1 Tax=Paenibacillus silvisoli TaxID=3110539 RepID=UPI002804F784|nr:GT-D fold domain-containing glycosyltransferase [Paenibacillus silvisoli]